MIPADTLDSTTISNDFDLWEYSSNNDKRNYFKVVFYKNIPHSTLNYYEPVPYSIFRNTFSIGKSRFIMDNSYSDSHESGILIEWTDKYGVKWATAKNVSNATGNKQIINKKRDFEITHSIYQPPHPQITIDLQKIRSEFNCVLYNMNGDSIKMTNGEFVGVFSNPYE